MRKPLVSQRKKRPRATAWQEILHRRSDALAQGGLAAVAPYGADRSLSPASEFEGLLSLVPQAARHFLPIAGAWPLVAAGRPANETVAYWETPKIRDHHILQLGFFAGQKGPDSWQVVDCVYYPSDTYFMSLNLLPTLAGGRRHTRLARRPRLGAVPQLSRRHRSLLRRENHDAGHSCHDQGLPRRS